MLHQQAPCTDCYTWGGFQKFVWWKRVTTVLLPILFVILMAFVLKENRLGALIAVTVLIADVAVFTALGRPACVVSVSASTDTVHLHHMLEVGDPNQTLGRNVIELYIGWRSMKARIYGPARKHWLLAVDGRFLNCTDARGGVVQEQFLSSDLQPIFLRDRVASLIMRLSTYQFATEIPR